MTFDVLWEVYRKRNPALQKTGGNVTMTVDNLRRLAKQAYDQGAKAAGGGGPDNTPGLFEQVFGGGRK